MEHLLQWSKCSIFHNVSKYIVFQRCQKKLSWIKGLEKNDQTLGIFVFISFEFFSQDYGRIATTFTWIYHDKSINP